MQGEQCTILWHMNNLKISHADAKVVDEIIDQLSKEYGQESPQTISRGEEHNYLGITGSHALKGKVKFSMAGYIQDQLRDLPESMAGECMAPASSHLFQVNKN